MQKNNITPLLYQLAKQVLEKGSITVAKKAAGSVRIVLGKNSLIFSFLCFLDENEPNHETISSIYYDDIKENKDKDHSQMLCNFV